jgi:hypothetical protein
MTLSERAEILRRCHLSYNRKRGIIILDDMLEDNISEHYFNYILASAPPSYKFSSWWMILIWLMKNLNNAALAKNIVSWRCFQLSRRFTLRFQRRREFNVYCALRSINPSPYLFFLIMEISTFGSSPEAQP